MALTGTEGGIPRGQVGAFRVPGYPHHSYRETDRVLATELREQPGAIAELLLRRFLDATVAFDYSPWVAPELG